MAHWKRKRSRRNVRCTMCTSFKWMGNRTGRIKPKYESEFAAYEREMEEYVEDMGRSYNGITSGLQPENISSTLIRSTSPANTDVKASE
jgi:hypothetical protein